MVDVTRYARIQPSVASLRSGEVTQYRPLRTLARPSVRALFNSRQRELASALREQPRPGLFVFAAHLEWGLLGRLWLEATEAPRAGLIGRHDEVDLALPLDEALSLRHLLFVVQRLPGGVQYQVIDLQTPHGLQLESGAPMALVEAAGPLVLAASDFVFFCFPTGTPPPWDPKHLDPWSTLPRRAPLRTEPLSCASGGPTAGWLEVDDPRGPRAVPLSVRALERGVLLGRYARCDVPLGCHGVSRVHLVLLAVGDAVFAIDAGSTNGTWCRDRPVTIHRLRDGDPLVLSETTVATWRGAE